MRAGHIEVFWDHAEAREVLAGVGGTIPAAKVADPVYRVAPGVPCDLLD